MIYLDHAATTKPGPGVLEIMSKTAEGFFGNPSSVHTMGTSAKKIINQAKKTIAATLEAQDSEICITSGGTEGNNLCIKMAVLPYLGVGRTSAPHIVTTAVEHPSVLESVKVMERLGAKVTRVMPGRDGCISARDVLDAVTPDTVLVSVMMANNEVGTVMPVDEIGPALRQLPYNSFGHRILFHVDGVQAYGQIPVSVKQWDIDLFTASAHKFYGPKGIGFLYRKDDVVLEALLSGGGQESGLRSGTENVPAVAGMEAAVTNAFADMQQRFERENALCEALLGGLRENVPGLIVNGREKGKKHLPGTLNVSVPGIGGETMLVWLDMAGICISTGSACAAGKKEPSYVLTSMGVSPELADCSLRFSLGRETTRQEIDETVRTVTETVRKLSAILGTN